MKKILFIYASILIITLVFFGCSHQNNSGASTSSDTDISSNEEDYYAEAADINDSETPIDEAEISSTDAVEIIKNFSMEQLGLEGEQDDYKFMVATTGKSLNDTNYFEIIASVVQSENDDGSISMETKGTYLVSYDGKVVLIENNETGEIKKL